MRYLNIKIIKKKRKYFFSLFVSANLQNHWMEIWIFYYYTIFYEKINKAAQKKKNNKSYRKN